MYSVWGTEVGAGTTTECPLPRLAALTPGGVLQRLLQFLSDGSVHNHIRTLTIGKIVAQKDTRGRNICSDFVSSLRSAYEPQPDQQTPFS